MNNKSEIQEILDSIRKIVQSLRISSRNAEKKLGISGAQLFVLQKLKESKGLSINELAERTKTHQSSVSAVASRLEKRELIKKVRNPMDKRRRKLQLTPQGRTMLKRMPATAQEKLIEALESMPLQKRKHLSVLLNDVVKRSGLSRRPPQLFFEEDSSS